ARKMYTSSTLQQKRNCTSSANYTISTSPRSVPSSPPQPASSLELASVLSPGETLLSLGSATAQATSIAAQSLELLASRPQLDKRKAETLSKCLHVVSRIWQDEVVRLSNRLGPNDLQKPQGTAESELRQALRELDSIYIDISKSDN
ncbi:hypothetical protein IWW36_004388, partial [Coemansia brasiliensis]